MNDYAAFPHVQKGREVHAGYPLAINDRVVVPPDGRLYFLHGRAQRSEGSGAEEVPSGRPRGGGMPLGGVGMGSMGLGGMQIGTAGEMPRGMSRYGFRSGLLLGRRKGAPTVLAVEEASAGEQAGFRAKDRIISLDGRRCPKSLSGFLALYRREKARGLKELTVVGERAGVLAPRSFAVPLPPGPGGGILEKPAE